MYFIAKIILSFSISTAAWFEAIRFADGHLLMSIIILVILQVLVKTMGHRLLAIPSRGEQERTELPFYIFFEEGFQKHKTQEISLNQQEESNNLTQDLLEK